MWTIVPIHLSSCVFVTNKQILWKTGAQHQSRAQSMTNGCVRSPKMGWGGGGGRDPPPSTSFLQVGICRQKGYGFWIVLVYNLKTAMDFGSQVWKRRLILQVTFENRYGFYSIFSPEMESEMGESGVTTPPKLLRSIPPPQTIRKDRLIDASCLFLNSAVS